MPQHSRTVHKFEALLRRGSQPLQLDVDWQLRHRRRHCISDQKAANWWQVQSDRVEKRLNANLSSAACRAGVLCDIQAHLGFVDDVICARIDLVDFDQQRWHILDIQLQDDWICWFDMLRVAGCIG